MAGPDRSNRSYEPDIRFSLANERTLLAYQRTAIGLVAAAVAFAHLLGDGVLVLVLAIVLLLAGAVAAVGGYQRYRVADRAIQEGRPLPSGATPHLLTTMVVLGVAAAAAYLLTQGR